MQHSIAAKYAARPAARFVRPSPRARERRLGLRTPARSRPRPRTRRRLRRTDLGPLRPAPRELALDPAGPCLGGAEAGRIRPVVTFRWMRLGRPIRRDRPSAASAPWLA